MSKSQKKADLWYSKYIRVRSAVEHDGEYYNKCISCGKPMLLKQSQCGHFIGRGKLIHRYNHLNTWPQCWVCNCLRSGESIHDYEQNLNELISPQVVEYLKDSRNNFCKLSKTDYEEIASKYKVLFLNLCADKGIIPW